MRFISRLFSLALVLALSSAGAFAQQSNSNWANVENLKNGAKIIVTTKNGREFIGVKRQSTDDTLFMETKLAVQGSRTISLTKDEIAEVSKTKSRWFYPLIGLGIGIGVGVAIGDTQDHRGGDDPGIGKVVGGLMGGAIGGAAGSFLSRKPGTKTIYVAP
jgi:hypothetical protein